MSLSRYPVEDVQYAYRMDGMDRNASSATWTH